MYMVHVNVCRHYFLFSHATRASDGLYPPTDGYMFDIFSDEWQSRACSMSIQIIILKGAT